MAHDRLFGKLADVRPLTEQERKRLFDTLKTDGDRREFKRIADRHHPGPPPSEDGHGHLLSQEARAIWNFGVEFSARSEAQDLRKFVDRTQTRTQHQTQFRPHQR